LGTLVLDTGAQLKKMQNFYVLAYAAYCGQPLNEQLHSSALPNHLEDEGMSGHPGNETLHFIKLST